MPLERLSSSAETPSIEEIASANSSERLLLSRCRDFLTHTVSSFTRLRRLAVPRSSAELHSARHRYGLSSRAIFRSHQSMPLGAEDILEYTHQLGLLCQLPRVCCKTESMAHLKSHTRPLRYTIWALAFVPKVVRLDRCELL